VRASPDYLTSSGFVECKGVGRDGTIKIKVEDYVSLQFWRLLMPVDIFVWDSSQRRWTQAPLGTIERLIGEGAFSTGVFDSETSSPKSYMGFDVAHFTWEQHNGKP
jgi:hypothetical protein